MKAMMKALDTYHPAWKIWIVILVSVNFIFPPFLLPHIEAIWTLLAGLSAAVVFMVLHKIQGFTRLLGIAHISWFVLVPYLFNRGSLVSEITPFSFWLWSIVIINAFSLIVDSVDVIRYLRGDRQKRA